MTARARFRQHFAAQMAHAIAAYRNARPWNAYRAAQYRATVYHYGKLKRMLQ